MPEISDRIAEVIKMAGMTKTAFADKINVSQPFISQIVAGSARPSDRTILDICREFHVNETWLRTGEGDMFLRRTRNEDLSAFFGDVLNGEPDFRQRLFLVMSRMTTSEWELLEQMANRLAEETKKAGPD